MVDAQVESSARIALGVSASLRGRAGRQRVMLYAVIVHRLAHTAAPPRRRASAVREAP